MVSLKGVLVLVFCIGCVSAIDYDIDRKVNEFFKKMKNSVDMIWKWVQVTANNGFVEINKIISMRNPSNQRQFKYQGVPKPDDTSASNDNSKADDLMMKNEKPNSDESTENKDISNADLVSKISTTATSTPILATNLTENHENTANTGDNTSSEPQWPVEPSANYNLENDPKISQSVQLPSLESESKNCLNSQVESINDTPLYSSSKEEPSKDDSVVYSNTKEESINSKDNPSAYPSENDSSVVSSDSKDAPSMYSDTKDNQTSLDNDPPTVKSSAETTTENKPETSESPSSIQSDHKVETNPDPFDRYEYKEHIKKSASTSIIYQQQNVIILFLFFLILIMSIYFFLLTKTQAHCPTIVIGDLNSGFKPTVKK